MTEKRFTIVNMGLDGRLIKEDGKIIELERVVDLLNENEQLRKSNERIIKDIDLALGFISHKGYSLQDIKDYEDWKNELKR